MKRLCVFLVCVGLGMMMGSLLAGIFAQEPEATASTSSRMHTAGMLVVTATVSLYCFSKGLSVTRESMHKDAHYRSLNNSLQAFMGGFAGAKLGWICYFLGLL